MGRIEFWKVFGMSKIKRIDTYEYAITMMIHRYIIPATSVYETVNSTPSIVDDPSAHVIEYISY